MYQENGSHHRRVMKNLWEKYTFFSRRNARGVENHSFIPWKKGRWNIDLCPYTGCGVVSDMNLHWTQWQTPSPRYLSQTNNSTIRSVGPVVPTFQPEDPSSPSYQQTTSIQDRRLVSPRGWRTVTVLETTKGGA